MATIDSQAVLRAVVSHRIDDMRAMIARDADLVNRLVDSDGRSSLFIACGIGSSAMVALLLSVTGVDVNRTNIRGSSPLYVAVSRDDLGEQHSDCEDPSSSRRYQHQSCHS